MRARGFTLVELMVCVAILAILAGIALPNFSTVIANAQIRSTADQLRDLVGRARQEALKRNVPVSLVAAGSVVTLSIPAFGATPALELLRVASKAKISNAMVTMTGSGRATAAATFEVGSPTLACQADNGPVICLSVQVFTGGAARMCDPIKTTGDVKACL